MIGGGAARTVRWDRGLLVASLAFSAAAALAACGVTTHPPISPRLSLAADSVDVTLFLVGDAGAPGPPRRSVPAALRAVAERARGRVVVVFLGDNVYPDGLPDSLHPGRLTAERRLGASVDAVAGANARGVFVPGNHDWGTRTDTGASALRRQAAFIARRSAGAAALLPEPGCPGPTVVDIGAWLRLAVLDTEWWLQHATNDAPLDPDCGPQNEQEVATALAVAIAGAGTRHVVVVAHHPIVSGAAHGGHFGWREHVFPLRELQQWLWIPLPVLGSSYPLARERGAWVEDVSNAAYRRMRVVLDSVFATGAPLVYASGHDHNLQVLDGAGARHLVVSGAGSDGTLNPVYRLPSTRFARRANGFIRLEFLGDGRVRLSVLTISSRRGVEEVYATWLT
jgi:hypothetical protein